MVILLNCKRVCLMSFLVHITEIKSDVFCVCKVLYSLRFLVLKWGEIARGGEQVSNCQGPTLNFCHYQFLSYSVSVESFQWLFCWKMQSHENGFICPRLITFAGYWRWLSLAHLVFSNDDDGEWQCWWPSIIISYIFDVPKSLQFVAMTSPIIYELQLLMSTELMMAKSRYD